jgi:hypothetical protein
VAQTSFVGLVVYLHRVRGIELEVAGLALATIALASLPGNAG